MKSVSGGNSKNTGEGERVTCRSGDSVRPIMSVARSGAPGSSNAASPCVHQAAPTMRPFARPRTRWMRGENRNQRASPRLISESHFTALTYATYEAVGVWSERRRL